MMETPVLFLVFNRPDVTRQVFEQIKKAKPKNLYIASDGPRNNKEEESEIILNLRDYLVQNVDWDCSLSTLFREDNLGCKYAVSSAIDWFFENEEMGIILEDDCLPSNSFFPFCEELLNYYKNDLRIFHISGNNLQPEWTRDEKSSYYFGGIYGSIWGWATWRNRWEKYDVEMNDYHSFIESGYLEDVFDGSLNVKKKAKELGKIHNGLNTWDYQWSFTRWVNSGLSIIPSVNLIQNIGFGDNATHTLSKKDKRIHLVAKEIEFPLHHPRYVLRDSISENKYAKTIPKLSLMDHLKIAIKRALGIDI